MTRVLVPVSGGKDSQACLKLAVSVYPPDEVLGLFCDTQFEHPLTYEHIEKIGQLYGVKIVKVSGGSVLEKSVKHKRFPGGGARHCTDELKIRETRIFCAEYAKLQGGFEVWYGMRSDESVDRNRKYSGKDWLDLHAPHEIMPRKYPQYLKALGVMFRLPIVDWTETEVFNYLDGEENPLYEFFDRVGCFPCLAASDNKKKKAFKHDAFGAEQFIKVSDIGRQIGKSVWIKDNKGTGCKICEI